MIRKRDRRMKLFFIPALSTFLLFFASPWLNAVGVLLGGAQLFYQGVQRKWTLTANRG